MDVIHSLCASDWRDLFSPKLPLGCKEPDQFCQEFCAGQLQENNLEQLRKSLVKTSVRMKLGPHKNRQHLSSRSQYQFDIQVLCCALEAHNLFLHPPQLKVCHVNHLGNENPGVYFWSA